MNDSIITLEGIKKDFSSVTVLDGINIAIQPGKVYALAGENGAGKSTLCNIIIGSLPPSSGSIYLPDGTKRDSLSVEDAKKLGIRMVHQELLTLPDMSIAENLFLGNEPHRGIFVDKKEMHARARDILKQVGMDISPRTPVRKLDIASRQLVEIAKAISHEARLIILDEPTSSLSENEAELLFNIIRKHKEKGTAFIFVSHRIEEILEISDSIFVLKDGRLVTELTSENATAELIIKNMVGRGYDDFYNRKRTCLGGEVLRVEHLTCGKEEHGSAYPPKDVSFTLNKGEVLGLAGLVGAGRTETLRMIFGNLKKAPGSKIFIDGKEVKIKSISDAKKCGMAWVTEDRKRQGVILDFSLKSNIALPNLSRLTNGLFVSGRKEKQLATEYIDMLKIRTTGPQQRMKYLSGGNQQKAVLSKWLAASPRILTLDEPTRGIDIGAKNEIYKLINELTANGVAVLIVSSELPELIGMCDRIIVMHEGHVTGTVEREQFSEELIMTYATGRKVSCDN